MNYNRSDAFFISTLYEPSSTIQSHISIIYLSNSLKDAWIIIMIKVEGFQFVQE